MKRLILFVVFACAVNAAGAPIAMKAHAEAAPAASGEPEYAGIFAERDPVSGQYNQLERLTPAQVTRVRGMGFGGASVRLEFPREASSVRFKAGQPVEFVVRVMSQEMDPVSLIQFYMLTPLKGKRVVQIVNVMGMGLKAEDTSHDHMVPFNATKLGEQFFKVVSQQPLSPGEYSLSTMSNRDGFCFGIDP